MPPQPHARRLGCACPPCGALEQLVATGPDTSRQADLVLTSPEGLQYALDLVFTGPLPDNVAPGPHLHRIAMGRAARYLTTPAATLPSGVQLWPIAYSATRPWLESHGVLMLHRLLTALAARSHGPGAPAWGPHFAALTAKSAADLACCLAVENWHCYTGCAAWAASVGGGAVVLLAHAALTTRTSVSTVSLCVCVVVATPDCQNPSENRQCSSPRE